MFPAKRTRLDPKTEVASAKAVPRSSWLPDVKDSPSPAETRNNPVVSEKIEPDELFVELDTGRNRSTGRVACEDRRTHFQSSLINVPRDGPEEIRSTLLNKFARLISRRFSEPAAT